MNIQFAGKTAIVTGAAHGFGRAIASKSISIYRHIKLPNRSGDLSGRPPYHAICRLPRDNAAAHTEYLASHSV